MAKGQTYSDKKIIEALKEAKGIQAEAARIVGCVRQTIANRIETSEEVREAYNIANETVKDTAENALYKLLQNEDHKDHFRALQFYLRTKAGDRGYSDRDEDASTELIENLTKAIQGLREGDDGYTSPDS